MASFDSAAFPAGTAAHATGSFGIREFSGEQADFRNLSVTSPTSTVLYQNALSDASAIADFDVPGNNTVPLILDGAKRDRAVWSGDLAVEGPTLFYSTATSDYIRGSLELLGSYAGSNGYVTGDMPPQTPINTAAPGAVRNAYSASYSMYFVRDLAEYYQYTADTPFVQKEWSLVANELDWSAAQVDGNGLFVTTNDNGADWDYYDGNKTGEVTAYNALYYQTLIDGAQLAKATGHPGAAAVYTARAAALKSAINSRSCSTRPPAPTSSATPATSSPRTRTRWRSSSASHRRTRSRESSPRSSRHCGARTARCPSPAATRTRSARSSRDSSSTRGSGRATPPTPCSCCPTSGAP